MKFDLHDGISVLERTPATLRALLSGLPDAWIRADEGDDTWSPFDNVGHLIDGEETDWMPRARIILGQGPDRRFEPYDRFRHLELNRGRSLEELLDRFAELRARNLDDLRAMEIGEEELRRTGKHPDFGPVTLEQLLSAWVVHDLGHVAQVCRVMAKQYGDAVGPWPEFLPVLTR